MAGRRGFSGRSREDLFAEAQHIAEMVAQLKGPRGRGQWRGGRPPFHAQGRPDRHWEQQTTPEWMESAWNPEGTWQSGRNWGHAGPDRPFRDRPNSPFQQIERPQEPTMRPRGQQQNRSNRRQQPPRTPNHPLTAQQLVSVLTQSQDFSISLLMLMEHYNLPPREVRSIVNTHQDVFHLQEEVVSLAPCLNLCAAHAGPKGCQRRDVCDCLHICPNYVLGWCSEKTCVLGHRWHTDHNLAILKQVYFEDVRYNILREVLRRSHGKGPRGEGLEADPLQVCKAYNEAGCDQLDCHNLHVCLSFVVGLTICNRDDCQLNHDLLSPACCHLLKLHRLPVNEAPRDVAMALLQANPNLKDRAGIDLSAKSRPSKAAAQIQPRKGTKDTKKPNQQPGGRKGQPQTRNESKSSSATESESESDSDDSDLQGNESRGTKKSEMSKPKIGKQGSSQNRAKTKKTLVADSESEEDADDQPDKSKKDDKKGKQDVTPKPSPCRTLWANYPYGDVVIPQICHDSVESLCQKETSGCQKLHSSRHFHWQAKEQGGRWTNLHYDQVTCIERAFCDPALENVKLPRLDPSKLDPSISGLLRLLGHDIWQADFSTNTLTNSTKIKTLQLRRLSTEPVVGQPIKAATYCWYFLDINKKWVKYGNADTSSNQHFVSSVTSADIESHYQKTPQQSLNFKNSKFTFVLDMTSMKQTNQLTGMSREVRRRPEPHLPNEKQKEKKSKEVSDLPSYWDAMQPGDCTLKITLAPTCDEYKKVIGYLGNTVSTANIVKLERIQNPFMWRALENKIKEMTAVYKNETLVNVRTLFHGTSPDKVANICSENFDWRLHGTSAGQAYGQGAYFGANAATSLGYCPTGSNGLKNMFVARVAVGSVTVGNSNMARPPINSVTSMPFDSTVDNISNPRLVVKYCKQEYYPMYLLTFS